MTKQLVGPRPGSRGGSSDVPSLLRTCADASPWLTIHEGQTSTSMTVPQTRTLAVRWASALRRVGVGPGDRVIVLEPNGFDFVGAFFGAHLLGAVPVPLVWPLSHDLSTLLATLDQLLTLTAPSAIVTTPRVCDSRSWDAPVVTSCHDPGPLVSRPYPLRPEHPALIQFASGPTTRPRGVVISHGAVIGCASAMGQALRCTRDDIAVSWLPLSHDMGLIGTLVCSLLHRFPLHLMSPSQFLLRPRRWLELMTSVRATISVAPNFAFDTTTRRVRHDTDLDLSSLRFVLNGSETVQRRTIEAFEKRFAAVGLRPKTVRPVYGLAENTLGVTFGDGINNDLEWRGRTVVSVGTALPGTIVEVRDPDGVPLAEDLEGEIVVSSTSVMSGYFGDVEASARVLRGSWLHTGDRGVLHEGRLYVTGRDKKLVIKGGHKFHPFEIEQVAARSVRATQNSVIAFPLMNASKGTEDLVVVAEVPDPPALFDELEKQLRCHLIEALGVRADVVQFFAHGALPRRDDGALDQNSCQDLIGAAS